MTRAACCVARSHPTTPQSSGSGQVLGPRFIEQLLPTGHNALAGPAVDFPFERYALFGVDATIDSMQHVWKAYWALETDCINRIILDCAENVTLGSPDDKCPVVTTTAYSDGRAMYDNDADFDWATETVRTVVRSRSEWAGLPPVRSQSRADGERNVSEHGDGGVDGAGRLSADAVQRDARPSREETHAFFRRARNVQYSFHMRALNAAGEDQLLETLLCFVWRVTVDWDFEDRSQVVVRYSFELVSDCTESAPSPSPTAGDSQATDGTADDSDDDFWQDSQGYPVLQVWSGLVLALLHEFLSLRSVAYGLRRLDKLRVLANMHERMDKDGAIHHHIATVEEDAARVGPFAAAHSCLTLSGNESGDGLGHPSEPDVDDADVGDHAHDHDHTDIIRWSTLRRKDKFAVIKLWFLVSTASNAMSVAFCLWMILSGYGAAGLDGPRVLLGAGAACQWMAIIQHLEHAPAYYMFIRTMKHSLPKIGNFMVGVAPVYAGLGMFGMVMFSSYAARFGNLSDTFITMFAVLNGDAQLETFDAVRIPSTLIVFVSNVYIVFLVVLFTYVVLMSLIAITEEAFFSSRPRSHADAHGRRLPSRLRALMDQLQEVENSVVSGGEHALVLGIGAAGSPSKTARRASTAGVTAPGTGAGGGGARASAPVPVPGAARRTSRERGGSAARSLGARGASLPDGSLGTGGVGSLGARVSRSHRRSSGLGSDDDAEDALGADQGDTRYIPQAHRAATRNRDNSADN